MASSTRFLGSLMGSRRDNNGYSTTITTAVESPLDELDEGDVVWSFTAEPITTDTIVEDSYTHPAAATAAAALFKPELQTSSSSSPPISTSPVSSTASGHFHAPQSAATGGAGLSAVLAASSDGSDEDGLHRRRRSSPLIQRKKTALNPTLSPAGAAAVSTVVAARPSGPYCALSRSAPMKVPIWKPARGRQVSFMMGRFGEESGEDDDDDFEDGGNGGEMVPPHEMVARSQQRTTTFSVFEGVGRTLKGRDLTRVRNAVMQQTGFLE